MKCRTEHRTYIPSESGLLHGQGHIPHHMGVSPRDRERQCILRGHRSEPCPLSRHIGVAVVARGYTVNLAHAGGQCHRSGYITCARVNEAGPIRMAVGTHRERREQRASRQCEDRFLGIWSRTVDIPVSRDSTCADMRVSILVALVGGCLSE